uniref:Phostensin/Taperin PP1-binding domain-containing protein n=1 Tax=Sinocyclocheilus grahami TaxID=75366 RepID=A0A672LM39_SINGR
MSLSALPEWKQLLLERKRREEEERERREREEEERLASMPAWKRGIIQRRRAKQDEEREREKERDGGQHTPDILGITEDIVPEQISKEIISPIQQSPFIRSENSFKRDNRGKEVIRDGENEYKMATNNRGREKNKETEKEIWRGHDREMWVEKMGSKSEGRERDRSTGRESWEADSSASLFSPVVGLRTIQDVSMAKSSPQLPVPVSLSLLQSVSTGREVGEISRDVSERDICPREAERDVEERGTCIVWRTQDVDEREEEREEELLEKEYLPPSLSPSPPLSDSLDAMSRIYNLKTVGSRTTVCISERKADMPPHSGPQGKYNLIRQAPSPDILPETAKLWNHGRDGDKTETIESTGAQMVQRQVERLQLREQEAGCGSHNDKKAQPTMESCPLVEPEIRVAEENSQKPPEQNSPSSSSPCTASPSSSPSPPLFSIRSASGGPGKRGTTITITPRRPAGAASSGGLPTVTPAVPKAAPQGHITTPAPSSTKEAGKKRYPTAEEIEVIGGYQNLERSCLVKSKGTLKAVSGFLYFCMTYTMRCCAHTVLGQYKLSMLKWDIESECDLSVVRPEYLCRL